jgi:hypothetical protein
MGIQGGRVMQMSGSYVRLFKEIAGLRGVLFYSCFMVSMALSLE